VLLDEFWAFVLPVLHDALVPGALGLGARAARLQLLRGALKWRKIQIQIKVIAVANQPLSYSYILHRRKVGLY
jgi:hypothetical protein